MRGDHAVRLSAHLVELASVPIASIVNELRTAVLSKRAESGIREAFGSLFRSFVRAAGLFRSILAPQYRNDLAQQRNRLLEQRNGLAQQRNRLGEQRDHVSQLDLFTLADRIDLHLTVAVRLTSAAAAATADRRLLGSHLSNRVVAALVHAAAGVRNEAGDLSGVDVAELLAIHRNGNDAELDLCGAFDLRVLAGAFPAFELRHVASLLAGRVPSVAEEDGGVERDQLCEKRTGLD